MLYSPYICFVWTILLVCQDVMADLLLFDDPFALTPKIERSKGDSCTVRIFQQAPENTLEDTHEVSYDPSACFQSPLTSYGGAILDFKGTVTAGIQYDRVGGIWIGELEVLRLTTPEPSIGKNITWRVEKDVTELLAYLSKSTIAYLFIPNTVNQLYSGRIFVDVNITFYKMQQTQSITPEIIPITGRLSSKTLLQDIARVNRTFHFRMPTSMSPEHKYTDVVAAELNVLLSAHACEEFWYSNLPNQLASEFKSCGGGSLRYIDVLIDGYVIHRFFPFPVVYTGGINPNLWHPISGIMSFDVRPYKADITMFLPILLLKSDHTLKILVHSSSSSGIWYADVSLSVYRRRNSHQAVGSVSAILAPPPVIKSNSKKFRRSGSIIWTYELTASYFIHTVYCSEYLQKCHNVNSTKILTARAANILSADQTLQRTRVNMSSMQEYTNLFGKRRTSFHNYPLELILKTNISLNKTEITAKLRMRRNRKEAWLEQGLSTRNLLEWGNSVDGFAVLNHSNGLNRKYGTQYSKTEQKMYIQVGGSTENCYQVVARSSNGSSTTDGSKIPSIENCSLPAHIRFCGIDLCTSIGFV